MALLTEIHRMSDYTLRDSALITSNGKLCVLLHDSATEGYVLCWKAPQRIPQPFSPGNDSSRSHGCAWQLFARSSGGSWDHGLDIRDFARTSGFGLHSGRAVVLCDHL